MKTLDLKEIDKHSIDIYEAVLKAAGRAQQIVNERVIKKQELEIESQLDELEELNTKIEIDYTYVEEEKPTTLAIQDLLDGKLDITYESEKEK